MLVEASPGTIPNLISQASYALTGNVESTRVPPKPGPHLCAQASRGRTPRNAMRWRHSGLSAGSRKPNGKGQSTTQHLNKSARMHTDHLLSHLVRKATDTQQASVFVHVRIRNQDSCTRRVNYLPFRAVSGCKPVMIVGVRAIMGLRGTLIWDRPQVIPS